MINIRKFLLKLQPNTILKFNRKYLFSLYLLALVAISISLYYALILSPADFKQGELVRIMYIHVPSAWLSLLLYGILSICCALFLFSGNNLYYLISFSIAKLGCAFALLTLITGSIWGKPTWGTWWVWDARLTSMLILAIQYVICVILDNALEDYNDNYMQKVAIYKLFGLINLPIVKFSVDIWNSLHQPASIFRLGGVTMHSSMMIPLFMMAFTLCFLSFCILLNNLSNAILKRKLLAIRIKKGA